MSLQLERFLLTLIVSALIIQGFPRVTKASPISVASYSAIVMDQKTGRVFYEKNAREPRRIASITKIMTAIIAIESGKLDETVTVSENAVRAIGSSIYLKPKEKVKLEDLVYGLMLRSGNDAAVAIAEHVGGSVDGFVYLMNEKATQIGMKNTHFANPHGLDDHEDHFSTAYDMALLTRYAMNNEKYRQIAGTRVHHSKNPYSKWDRQWNNKHRLVTGLYKYATGGKTGYTERAKRTLVSTASKDGMDLITVTLNSMGQADWSEHIQMFEYVFSNYQYKTLLQAGPIKKVKNSVYKKHAYLARDFVYPVNKDEMSAFRIKYNFVTPNKGWKRHPEQIPEIIGETEIYFNEELIESLPIYFQYDEEEEKNKFFKFAK